jgi:metal-responsive CopG/Arc/MetJ family transcriptional regulator
VSVKIAVSIPDPVYREAERAAKHLGLSRSRLYATALSEFLARHKPANVKAQLDQVYSAECARLDKVVDRMQSLSLPREDW